jgi:cellulase
MKFVTLASVLPLVSGHAIFQRVSINGADQGLLTGVRAPNSNYPIQNVQAAEIACNSNFRQPVSSTILTIPAGARVGAQWQHLIGGPQGSNDPDNPIAASHKGPIVVYLAKVSNAASSGTSGLSWFKIAEEGFNTGTQKWAVDTMISGGGWWNFNFPSCIAPGQYLMRVEIIALHSASITGEAQFYPACAQIQVTGSGTFTPSSTVSFPGAYNANDPGIKISIYGSGGQPNNGGRSYPIPGPSVITCPSGNGNGGFTTTTRGNTQQTTTAGNNNGGSGAPLYGQCGGNGWTGPKTCAQGRCVANGDWYSQCVP